MNNLKTKIFLDSGDLAETRQALELLGFLDGQTTNPSLVAKNPEVAADLAGGRKFGKEELLGFYKTLVVELSRLIPNGSVSIEVYADESTTAEQMMAEGKEMFSWIDNAHIKLPITKAGLKAAAQLVKEGVRVNMTLCFSQEQAAAVHTATLGAKPGQVFVSPFIGRLDDQGLNGLDLIKNIIMMYQAAESPVRVLAASLRHLDHLLCSLSLGADIITSPFKVIKQWQAAGFKLPANDYQYSPDLKAMDYLRLDLTKDWSEFNIRHDLTDIGLQKFAADWNSLLN
jgi:transaldolase